MAAFQLEQWHAMVPNRTESMPEQRNVKYIYACQ